MPILKVEIVEEPGCATPRDLASRLADAAAEALGARPGHLWVRMEIVPAENYAENGGEGRDAAPVLVSVLEHDLPGEEVLQAQAAKLTRAIAGAIGRNADTVHLIYEAPGRGRVAFGGKLQT